MADKRVFRQPKSAVEEKVCLEKSVPKTTRYVTKWAFKIFREWQSARENKDPSLEEIGFHVEIDKIQSLETNIVNMTAESLNFWLTKFVHEVCKADGERYPARSLYSIVCGLQRQLEEGNGIGEYIKLLSKDERRLSTFRRALDSEMKASCEDGVANKTRKEEKCGVTEEEEKLLWDKNLLGCQTARSLLHTVYFYNGKLFGLRAKEHRNLRYDSFTVESNCVIYKESVSKTYHGGLKDLKYTPRVVKHVCCGEDNAEHFPCLVNCYSLYLENIKRLSDEVDAFYFRPNPDPTVFRYQRSAVGINTLNKILPDMLCGAAGLARKTSHSLRVTCATRLFQQSVNEKLIRERTGHRSNALFNYEKKSEAQERNVSKILGPPANLAESGNTNLNEGNSQDGENDFGLWNQDVDVSDELLSNMPMPGEVDKPVPTLNVNEMSSSVFHNCVFNNICKW